MKLLVANMAILIYTHVSTRVAVTTLSYVSYTWYSRKIWVARLSSRRLECERLKDRRLRVLGIRS
jgi:hypothetical protein